MAVYNRLDMTIETVKKLQEMSDDLIEIDITVCDDGSTDGTSDKLKSLFPNVKVIQTSGDQFWAKSMAIADKESFQFEYDYLVWLNDDTTLNSDSFQCIISDYKTLSRNDCILVGALHDPITKLRSYSGCVHYEIGHDNHLEFISPMGIPVKIGMFSGNFVVIPKSVRAIVGPISSKFSHGWADMYYGFQAKKLKVDIFLMSDYVGSSALNPLYSFHQKKDNSLTKRIMHIYGRKAYQPFDYLRFCLGSFGISGLKIYIENMIRVGKETFHAK